MPMAALHPKLPLGNYFSRSVATGRSDKRQLSTHQRLEAACALKDRGGEFEDHGFSASMRSIALFDIVSTFFNEPR